MTVEAVVIVVILVVLAAALLLRSVRVVRPDERGVVFRLGRVRPGVREPGLTMIVPTLDRLERVPMQTRETDAPVDEVVTRDNVTMRIGAVVRVRVVDPVKATIGVADHLAAVSQVMRTSLRSFVGHCDFDELAGSDREQINAQLREFVAEPTEEPWGLQIERVEIVVPEARPEGNSSAGR